MFRIHSYSGILIYYINKLYNIFNRIKRGSSILYDERIKFIGYGESHTGRQRSQNEDTYICDTEKSIFLVADGMGGEKYGEVASQITAKTFVKLIGPFMNDDDITIPFEHHKEQDILMNAIHHAVEGANEAVIAYAEQYKNHKGMGSTLTAAIFSEQSMIVAHVGDSRLYRIEKTQIKQLTEDHTKVQEMVRKQLLTKEEARVHPQRNIITRCIGRKNRFSPDIFKVDIQENDRFLIASDGLSDMVSDSEIYNIIIENHGIEESAIKLINQANENGGKDNITVILVEAQL